MGVDRKACVAYGIRFNQDVDLQKLLELSDQEFESMRNQTGESSYGIEYASLYSECDSLFYLLKSMVQIDQHEHQLIQTFEPSPQLEHEFWLNLGPKLTQRIQTLGLQPSWSLMFQFT